LVSLQATKTFDIVQWTAAGCPPTVEPVKNEIPDCQKRRVTAWEKIAQLKPEVVLLGGGWGRYLESGQSQDEVLCMLSATVRRLKKQGINRIVIFGPGPLFTTTISNDLFRFMAKKRLDTIPVRFGEVSVALWHLDSAIAGLADSEGVQYESILNFFCNASGCLTVGDRSLQRPDLLYRDRDHLTVSGSRILIEHSNLF
jgi:hypothetical protein